MGTAYRAPTMLIAAVVLSAQAAAAQSPTVLAGTYSESIRSEIITQTGVIERRRIILRATQYGISARADTLVVTADTMSLSESVEGVRTAINVDAVIGARWKIIPGPHGVPEVTDRPVVPQQIADVSDVGTAMDDFFPATPPTMARGGQLTDSAGRGWRRLADSSGIERYHYSGEHRGTTRNVGDSLTVDTSQRGSETTDFSWDPRVGPLGWTRTILTTVTTRFGGRTVRAQVDQRITVRRTH